MRAVIAPMCASRPVPAVLQVLREILIRKCVSHVAEGPHPKCREEYAAASERTNYPERYAQGFFHRSPQRAYVGLTPKFSCKQHYRIAVNPHPKSACQLQRLLGCRAGRSSGRATYGTTNQ
jgi:hypothetical protein